MSFTASKHLGKLKKTIDLDGTFADSGIAVDLWNDWKAGDLFINSEADGAYELEAATGTITVGPSNLLTDVEGLGLAYLPNVGPTLLAMTSNGELWYDLNTEAAATMLGTLPNPEGDIFTGMASLPPVKDPSGYWISKGIVGTKKADTVTLLLNKNDVYTLGGNDTVYGSSGWEFVDVGKGNDRVFGGDGDDLIAGGAGRDVLKGEDGNDRLTGGRGKNKLVGGSGADLFVFSDKDAKKKHVLTDFSIADGDQISIRSYRVGDFYDLRIKARGEDTLIKWGKDKILLKNVDFESLDDTIIDVVG